MDSDRLDLARAWRPSLGAVAVGLVALAALVVGWWTFWFLCDDAFIAFRYVANRQAGFGYTWNPPPFLPVEGYTSWLWVVLLDAVWTLTEVEPPRSANALSLGLSVVSLALTALLALRLLPDAFARYRLVFLALVLGGTVSNRTFLAWTSSGLETALFTAAVLTWVAIGLLAQPSRAVATAWVAAAVAVALTRPDGLLFVALTALWVVGWAARRRSWAGLTALAPVGLTLGHLLWRRLTYGAWLPNTYYAKAVAPWPEAGLRYLASFALEYALWVWAAVALAAAVAAVARRQLRAEVGPAVVVVLTVAAHAGYYTLVIGGDHFEYRVYHHLVPLALVSMPWLLGRIAGWPRAGAGLMGAMLALGLVLPWTHWSLTHDRLTREETRTMRVKVAPHLPAALRPYAAEWDDLQRWLIGRWIGSRHQEHKVFLLDQLERYPTRAAGLALDVRDRPTFTRGGVGVPGWTLPGVAILDIYGLNDFVVARTPKPPDKRRRMAHDRRPPEGYFECARWGAVSCASARARARSPTRTSAPARRATAPSSGRTALRPDPVRRRACGGL